MLPNLLLPVTNNAVTVADRQGRKFVFSLMGLGSRKTFDAITNSAFVVSPGQQAWGRIPDVPGLGRIAATAQAVGANVYLFGGYTVSASAAEHTVPNLDVYDIVGGTWSRGADVPVPVDDAVSAVYQDRFVYLVSGWSERANVANVQIYDTVTDRWEQAAPILGAPVFGHFGSIVGNSIFYFGGVSDAGGHFTSSTTCWRGDIDASNMTKITWVELPAHPGHSRYRAGAASAPRSGHLIIVGGTDNPYNYDGIGYDGQPSNPVDDILGWNLRSARWELIGSSQANMDLRGVVSLDGEQRTIGGMERMQIVSRTVRSIGHA